MNCLQDLLPRTMAKYKLDKAYYAELLSCDWQSVVGEEISRHSYLDSIRVHTALIVTDNPVWCHHLTTIQNELLEKLNAYIGERLILHIRFTAGSLKNGRHSNNDADDRRFIVQEMPLTDKELAQARQLVSCIEDPALRHKLLHLAKKNIAFQKIKTAKAWHKCQSCETLCPPEESYCSACSIEQHAKMQEQIRSLLKEAPWISFADCAAYTHCTRFEYNQAKSDVAARLFRDLLFFSEDPIQLSTYIMLTKQVKPENIQNQLLQATLAKIRRGKNVSAPRR